MLPAWGVWAFYAYCRWTDSPDDTPYKGAAALALIPCILILMPSSSLIAAIVGFMSKPSMTDLSKVIHQRPLLVMVIIYVSALCWEYKTRHDALLESKSQALKAYQENLDLLQNQRAQEHKESQKSRMN